MATASSTERTRPKTFACGLSAGGAVCARGGGTTGAGAGVIGGVGDTGGGGAGVTGGVCACATLLAARSAAHPTAHNVLHDLMERSPLAATLSEGVGPRDR